jgi:hypothetical protein
MADFVIKLDGGKRIEVDTKPADLVRFERQFKLPVEVISSDPRVEYAMFLAWAAAKRTGQTDEDFDTFMDHVEDFDAGDGDIPLDQPVA